MMKISFTRSLLIVSVITFMLLGASYAENEAGEHGDTPQNDFFTGASNMIFHDQEIKKASETKYYKYQVGSDWDSKKHHFTAVVHSEHPYSHFDVYISKTTKTPGPKDPDATTKKCQSFGHDVCFWPKNDIHVNDIITVGIHCWSNCHYTLELQVVEETIIKDSTHHKTVLHFGDSPSRIVKLHIPKVDDANHIIIQVQPMNAYLFQDRYDVFVNKGEEVPDSKRHDITVTESYGHGKAAIIYKDNKPNSLFCTDCYYTIEITASIGAIFEIRTEVRGQVIPIKDHAFGAVLSGQNYLVYKFEPSQIPHYKRIFSELKKMDLFIDVHSYSGAPNVYVHPNTMPATLGDYKWKYIYNIHDMISLTQMERQSERATEQVYYIAVSAGSSSTFTLNIHYGKKEGHNVKFGVVERGELKPSEMINFKLDVFVQRTLDFHVAMTKLGANATLIMKQCPRPLNKTTCQVTLADYQKITDKKVTPADKLYATTHSGRFETIDITLKESDCQIEKAHDHGEHLQTHGLTVGHCIYAIAVYAPPTPAGKRAVNSPYAFLAYHPEHSHVLHEGHATHGSLDPFSNHLYSFTLPNDPSVTNVSFHITPITGEPVLYVRRGAANPDKTHKEKVAGWLNDRAIYSDADAHGTYKLTNVTYYMKVETDKDHAYYSLSVVVHRTNQTFANHTHMVLREGIPFKYTMLHYDSEAFFKFNYYPTHDKESLTLHILPIHGHFDLSIANAKDLQDEFVSYQETVSNELHVQVPATVSHRMITYIVRVRSVDGRNPEHHHHSNQSRENHTVMTHPQFQIYWKRDDTYTVLTEKHPHSGSIKGHTFQYFQIQVGDTNTNLYVNRHAINGQIEVFFSYNNTNTHPNDEHMDGKLGETGADSYPINKDDIKKACDHQHQMQGKTKGHCYIWIAVRNPKPVQVQYTLSVTKQEAIHFLANGIPTPHNYPIGDHRKSEVHRFAVFAGHAANTSEPFTITTNADKRGLQILVNVYSENHAIVKSDELDKHFPSTTNHHYNSNTSCWASYQQVVVSHEDLVAKCAKGKHCLLLISVQRDPHCEIPDDGWHKYTITASSLIEQLTEGHPAHGKLSERQFKYYHFHMPHEKHDILISASTTVGSVSLFVSHNKTNSNIRPNLNFYDWRTWSSDNNILELGPEDMKDGSKNMDGEYYIMVFCNSQNCTYSLNVMYEDQKIGQLHPRQVYDVLSKKNTTYYHLLTTWGAQTHELIITKNHGSAKIFAKLWNAHEEIYLHVPVAGEQGVVSIDMANKNYGTLKLEVPQKTCYYCKWVIGVQFPANGGSFSIVAKDLTNISPTTLPAGKSFIDEAAPFATYSFEIWKNQVFHFDLEVLSGYVTVYLGTQYPYANTTLKNSNFKKVSLNGTKKVNLTASFKEIQAFAHCFTGYWCERSRNVYVMVEAGANSKAMYRVRGHNENTIITLQDGRYEQFHNQPNQKSVFKFVSPHSTLKNKRYNLNIKITYPYKILLSDIKVDSYFSPARLGGEERNKRNARVLRNGTNPTTREIFRQIHAEDGTFYFEIINTHRNESLDFSVLISSGDLISMTTHETHNSFVPVNETEIYEITSNQTGFLAIEVNSCDGRVSMEVANDISFANSQKIIHNDELFHSHQISSVGSKTYIKITGVEGTHDANDFEHRHEAGYTIKTSLLSAQAQKRTHIFAPGNDGDLDYTHTSQGNYSVEYSPIVILDPEEQKKAHEYNFHYTVLSDTNKHNLQRQAKCGSFYAKSHGKQVEWSTHGNCPQGSTYCSVHVNFDTMDKSVKTHYLTIVGWAFHRTTRVSSHVNYQVIEFEVEPSVFRSVVKTPWWAKLLAVVVVLLVVVVVLLMRRANTLKDKLDYEMNDVRNVAGGMPSIPGVSNRSGLVEDKHIFTEMQEKI